MSEGRHKNKLPFDLLLWNKTAAAVAQSVTAFPPYGERLGVWIPCSRDRPKSLNDSDSSTAKRSATGVSVTIMMSRVTVGVER